MSTDSPATHQTGYVTNEDGVSIYYQYWLPKTNHQANLIITHGIGEHSGRYRHVINHLLPHGFTVIAGDHQGHGLSGGKRGHVNHFHEFARDLELVRNTTLNIQENKPTFILGHSLGGLIALDHLLRFTQSVYAGAVFSSPAFGIKVPIPAWKNTLAKILAGVLPSFTMGNGIDPDDLSRDRDEVEIYRKDELVHDRVSAAMFISMLQVINEVHTNAKNISIPVLLMLGENDKVISIPDAKKLFSLLGTVDKKQYICPVSNHELFNELDRSHNLEELWTWLNQELATSRKQP